MSAIGEFRTAAERFRQAVEDAAASPPGGLSARRLRNAVARLYLAAALLPRVALDEPAGKEPTPAQRQSDALEAALRDRFGPADTFVAVSDPTRAEADDPVRRTLAGELVEIYEDVGDALALLDAGGGPEALWDIGFAFETHWGKHAVDVLRPLHQLATGPLRQSSQPS